MLTPIPDFVGSETALVLLCRQIRRLQKRRSLTVDSEHDLLELQEALDRALAKYDLDKDLRDKRDQV